ncbi:MAG: M14 family metallopeptidase [Bacteroidales bacterium]
MKKDLFRFCGTLMLAFAALSVSAQSFSIPDILFSRAEKTNFSETTLSAEVVAFCEAVGSMSDLATVRRFGTTTDGNDLVMLILAKPAVLTPEEAKASGKPVIYIQGNIHAGEVEGKEASIQLIREICFGTKTDLLDDQILIFCPNYNPDGNDKLSATSRPSQQGSPLLTGVRTSGEGYDLNREGIKAEALEMKALLSEIIIKWDPVLLVDLHTDNGSWHGYDLTYAPPFQSAGMASVTQYLTDKMLPEITTEVLNRSGMPFFYHGYLRVRPGQEQPSFVTYSHLPRYLVNYMGLRNRMAILSETFAHMKFEKRILSNYVFLVSVLEYTNEFGREMMEIVKRADSETIEVISENDGSLTRGVSFAMAAEPEPISLLTRETESYRDESGRTRTKPTGRLHWVDNVIHMNHFEPGILTDVPYGYYFPSELKSVAEKLAEHGIEVSVTGRRERINASVFTISKFTQSTRASYGNHRTVTVEGTFGRKQVNIPAGSYFVDMRQPLAWLILYMLEPQSDDGLLYWNYFDDYLVPRGVETKPVEFPVYKLMQPVK